MTAIVIITFNIDHRIFIFQIEAIKKFCTDDYVIEVIDNSTNKEKSEAIKYHAGIQQVSYRKTEPGEIDSSHSHAFAANLSFKMLFEFYDYFFYLDHDCIPVKPFSVVDILGDYDAAGVVAGIDVKYLWPGCMMWNNKTVDRGLIDFTPSHEMRTDTGGGSYVLLERYKCLFFDEIGCYNPHFANTKLYYFYMMIYNETFIHFLNGSDWNSTKYNDQRLNSLMNIANERIQLNETSNNSSLQE